MAVFVVRQPPLSNILEEVLRLYRSNDASEKSTNNLYNNRVQFSIRFRIILERIQKIVV